LLLLAALLAATAAGTALTAQRVADRDREQLAREAREVATTLDDRLREYTEVLRGAAAFANVTPTLTPAAFHAFVTTDRVAQRYPGVTSIAYASYLPAGADVAAFEQRTRRALAASGLGYGPYEVRPASMAARERLPVTMAVPRPDPTRPFGLDFLSEPNRARAARLAYRTGEPAATAPIKLAGSVGGPALGMDLMVPVFGGPPSRTGNPRPWRGITYAVFRMDTLLRGVLGALDPDLSVRVYDLGSAAIVPAEAGLSRRAVAFDPAPLPRMADARVQVATLAVGGRRWAVRYARPTSTLSTSERSVPWIIGVGGVLLSLLAAALLRAQATAQRRAVAIAETMTEELRRREGELQQSNAELEHFAYLASHDLQEPLRTITAYAGLLESRTADRLDERSTTWLGFITDGATRMSHLIADLLEYSRTGRDASSAGPPPTAPLDDAWDTAVASLAEAIERSDAEVTRGPLPVVRASPGDMSRLLANLITNALKYHGERPPVVRAQARRVPGAWEMRIRDEGIGIEPRFHDRIFGLFQRLHTADEYAGTGMGLAIVRKIVESNGGSVSIESEPGSGATFIITLPGVEDPE
jgi:signal transduction histidine kinase